jgi:hypothetical protein
LPFLYVEIFDGIKPGSLESFKNYMQGAKHDIVMSATLTYGPNNTSRLETFKIYVERIYRAYFSGLNSQGRMNILYNNISNPKIMERLY